MISVTIHIVHVRHRHAQPLL